MLQQPSIAQNTRVNSRAWVYTIFNCDGLPEHRDNVIRKHIDESKLTQWFNQLEALYIDGRIKYAVGQCERCPTSGRLHIQLYCVYHSPVKIGRLKRLLGLGDGYGWAEYRRATHEQAVKYHTKVSLLY